MFQARVLKLKMYASRTDKLEICGEPRDIFKEIKEYIKHIQFHHNILLILLSLCGIYEMPYVETTAVRPYHLWPVISD
jgi:hypothetical protein